QILDRGKPPLTEGGLEKPTLDGLLVIVLADHSNAVITERQAQSFQRGLRDRRKEQPAPLIELGEEFLGTQHRARRGMRLYAPAARITIPALGTRTLWPSVCVVENAMAPTAAPKRKSCGIWNRRTARCRSAPRSARGPQNHRRAPPNRRIRARRTLPPFCISRTRCRGIL